MKAAFLESTGAPDVIHFGDLPTPTPKQGEILVRVKAAALNPIDLYIRAGIVAMTLPKPFITGTDVAGTIEAVGPGARRFKEGDRVWGSNQGLLGARLPCTRSTLISGGVRCMRCWAPMGRGSPR